MNKSNIALTLAIVAILFTGYGMVGGNQSDQNVGATRFPSGISTTGTLVGGAITGDSITVDGAKALQNGSATSSINLGKACLTIIDSSDVSLFMSVSTTTGTWATSSVSCN